MTLVQQTLDESTDRDSERQAIGTAAELGVAVYEGLDPSETTFYDDGTHYGPPHFKETGKPFTTLAGMTNYHLLLCCSCGHAIREINHADTYKQGVECDGTVPSVHKFQAIHKIGRGDQVVEL